RVAIYDRDQRVAGADSEMEWSHHFDHAFKNPESEQQMADHTMEVTRHSVEGYNGLTHGPIGRILFVRIRKQMELLRGEVLRIIVIGGAIAFFVAALINFLLGRRPTPPIHY